MDAKLRSRRTDLRSSALIVVLSGAMLLNGARAQEGEVVAVASRASDDYVRARLPDGSFQAEPYAFGKGGYWSSATNDPTIDKMDFMDIARTIAGSLKRQNYIPSTDPKTIKLLIMVYWGTTQAPEHTNDTATFQNSVRAATALAQAKDSKLPPNVIAQIDDEFTTATMALQGENAQRDMINAKNAKMLGFDSWWVATAGFEGTPLQHRWQDMLDALEEDRYFVVLMAYDFRLMWREKKPKLLWETRFSIRAHRHRFDQELAAMALDASQYFGRDSHGLIRERLPDAHITIGEPKVLEYEPEKRN